MRYGYRNNKIVTHIWAYSRKERVTKERKGEYRKTKKKESETDKRYSDVKRKYIE